MMYIASGDGGSGESGGAARSNPQRLDSLVGKILRIQPTETGTGGDYSIPADNPFATTAGVESRRVFDIVRDRWDLRNETATGSVDLTGIADGDRLPGGAATTNGSDPYGVAYGGGRADIRLAVIDDELYLLSKSDGMVRAIGAAHFVLDVAAGTAPQSEAGYAALDWGLSLTKSGAGSVVLDAANGFTGPVIVTGGTVNVFDLVGVNAAESYGTGRPSAWQTGDFDYDGATNVFDLVRVNTAGAYGRGEYLPPRSPAPAPVPEPGVGLPLIGCLLPLLGGRPLTSLSLRPIAGDRRCN
jgi:autotransporter-associated beta strand protein